MMDSGNLLRKQVVSEIKKRRLIFFTIMLLSFIYLITTLFFGDRGLLKYIELNKTEARMERQIKELEKDNEYLRSEIKSLKEDPFYIEKHAREDFGLVRPDEYIFQYDR
jgi:cell division protein FtsB